MTLEERLRTLVSALPSGGAVTLTRTDLVALLEDAGDVGSFPTSDLTVEEVAAETHRAPSTVRTWLTSGELRGYKLMGKAWRIPRAALRAFLDAQGAPPEPPMDPDKVDIGAWRRVRGDAA